MRFGTGTFRYFLGSMRQAPKGICFLGALFLLVVQCTPFFFRRPVVLDATPEQIVESIATNVEQLVDLEGRIAVQLTASSMNETAVAKIAYRKPDMLKVEVKGFLGVTVANVQMRGDTVSVYYPLSNFLVQGRPSAENFELMTGLRLDVSDLESVIFGEGEMFREALNHLVDFRVEGGEYMMSFQWNGRVQRHRVDPKILMVTRSDFFDDEGGLEIQHIYRNYEMFNGLRLPTKVEIVKGRERHRVLLTLEDGAVNQGISDDRFQMNMPTDVDRIELRN